MNKEKIKIEENKGKDETMNKINDYNIKMLEALHAVFWYEGLLEQDKDEWVDFKKAMVSMHFLVQSMQRIVFLSCLLRH